MSKASLADFSLEGRNLLITGAGSGIGRAFLEASLAEGANCLALVESSRQARELEAIMPRDRIRAVDLADLDGLSDRIASALKALPGPVDGCLSCAGVLDLRGGLDTTDEQWARVLNINLNAGFIIARECGRIMKGQGTGALLFVSSQIGDRGHPKAASYAASKGGINGLTRALALELAPDGIRVNALAPGPTITPMTEGPRSDPARLAYWEERIPLGRYGDAGEIAQAARFLLSDAASYITGQVLFVDGGLTTV